MPGVEVRGQYQLRLLSARLRDAGKEGQGLRRKMYKQMNDAAKPLAREIANVEHLKPYMPDRYAAILAADLGVRIAKSFSKNPRIEVRAKAKQHKRKVVLLDAGRINHPIYAQGERKTWRWSNAQAGGMKAGFFSDVLKEQSPQIRDQVMKAMTETARSITGK
jgi:16S rRNA C967 or C1407 C5-methylase (RsmB/RsmF family)